MSLRSRRWIGATLGSGGDVWIELRGASMEPTLRDGDRLRVSPLVGDGLQPGEVVVTELGGRLVAHRLVSLDSGAAVLRGDGNLRDDPPIPAPALLGRVVEVSRGGRRFLPPRRAHAVRRVMHWVRCRVARSA